MNAFSKDRNVEALFATNNEKRTKTQKDFFKRISELKQVRSVWEATVKIGVSDD